MKPGRIEPRRREYRIDQCEAKLHNIVQEFRITSPRPRRLREFADTLDAQAKSLREVADEWDRGK